jgi:capsular polysaccharide biosynthesis protein
VIALQRNDQNYFEFRTDILPSRLTWESPQFFSSHRVIAKSSFAKPLLRLIGFKIPITQIAAPFTAVAPNITAIRMLNSGRVLPDSIQGNSSPRPLRLGSGTGCEVAVISRSAQSDRQFTNGAAVITTIKEHFPDADILYPGGVPVEEQVRHMADARIVIATHGAEAVNMVWATSMEHHIETSFYSPQTNQCFSALAKVLSRASVQLVRSRALKPGDHFSDHACDLEALRSVFRQ